VSVRTDHLRYFVAVAEEGQITRAATKLFIAQPALSQAITQLEATLAIKLFERHPRGVTLTAAGEAFFEKARVAVENERELERTAASLTRGAKKVLEIGFVGPPPTMTTPDLFAAFAQAHPDARLSFRDLPFPSGPTRAWLADVDLAFCHAPEADESIRIQPVRVEPRAVICHRTHRLAERSDLTVAEVIDETFVGYDPDAQPAWVGFHNLDDERGGAPRSCTAGEATTTMQMLGLLTAGEAITTVPHADARLAPKVTPELVAIPLRDGAPAVVSLVWDAARPHPLIDALAKVAARARSPVEEVAPATSEAQP
jgi:DNA-binding transcriptional LysR family regulator